MRSKIFFQTAILFLVLTLLTTNLKAQTLPLSFNFQSSTLPAGLSTNGTISTSGTIGTCTVCSPGRLVIDLSGWFQIDVPAVSVANLNMKSSGSSARTVTIKYKHAGDPDYITAGTVSVPQSGGTFELVTLFPSIASVTTTSIRVENAASGGQFHIHDVFVNGSASQSTEAEILGFTIPSQIGTETINSVTGKVEILVPSGTPLNSVTPSSVTLSTAATINPLATTPRDFSGAVEVPYVVTAQDGTTTKNWTVKVIEVLSSEKEITSFSLASYQVGSAVINSAAGTISVVMPDTASLNNLIPQTLSISNNATVSPLPTIARNFSSPVVYTVTAQDGSTKAWTITVSVVPVGGSFTNYEAEEADFTGTVDNNHTGYSGTGFINFLANGENYIIFNVCQTVAGVRTAKFRYAMATTPERIGKLFVNDVYIQDLTFPNTGTWTNWLEETAALNLQAGMNRIKITWDSTDGPNLDKLALTGTQCAQYTLSVNTTNSGTVSLTPVRFANKYFNVETVTLLANALPTLSFDNWSGDLTGTTNPAQLPMTSNKSVTANFTPIPTFTLLVNTVGIGSVTLSPEGGVYPVGTSVTLTAVTAFGSTFLGWSGDATGTTTPTVVVMNSNKTVTATFSNSAAINFETPIGFASTNTGSTYPNFNGPVTGGQNATDTFWVNGPANFDTLAWHLYYRNRAYKNQSGTNGVPKAPLVIVFMPGVYPEGTSSSSAWGNSMMTIQEQGDLTIIGKSGVFLNWGFNIKRSWNILIRNIHFQDYYDDGVNIGEPETHHIWIDHCTLGHPTTMPSNSDHPDGGADTKGGASYVTISWCIFRNSWKTSLVGHSDGNGAEDIGKLKVTFYANHFLNSNSRHPRVRFGEVHVLNNLSEHLGLYGIASAKEARVVAEGNFYLNTRWPMYADRTVADFKAVYGNNTDNVFTSKTGNIPCVYLKQFDNDYDDSGLPIITAQINPAMLNPGGRSIKFDEFNAAAAFDPHSYYTYTAFPASVVRTIVPPFAGADKINFFNPAASTPSISVNGTLSAFTQPIGSPSAAQTYTVSATNLTGNLIITPPVNFEVSNNGGTTWFTNTTPLSILPVSGSITNATISVRLNALATGNYGGDITHNSANATTIDLPVSGMTTTPPATDRLISWPLSVDNIDNALERNIGIVPTVPSFNNLYLSNGTTVATVPGYSVLHGQAFGTDAAGTGLWGSSSGGPGGSLKRFFYEEFKVTAKAGYTAKIDSVILNAAFHNSSSGTFLGVVYSRSGFVNDSTDIQGGGVNYDGTPLANTAGSFATPIALLNRTTPGTPDNYRLAIAEATGVALQPGETLTVRFYFSCGSSSSGRYAKIKELYFKGSTQVFVPAPSVTITASLNTFSQTIGSPSAAQTYTVSGVNLTGNVIITPPAGYQVSSDGGATWFTNASPLVLTPTSGTLLNTTVTVRLNAGSAGTYIGNITHMSTGTTVQNVAVNGTAINAPALVISGSLSAFTQTIGAPSATKTYTISGANLTGSVTITPPANYQVSANAGVTWFNNSTPLVLTPTAGTLGVTTITVRLNAATAGSYSGNIAHSSPGSSTINIAVSGVAVNPANTSVTATLNPFEQTIGTPSIAQLFTVQGNFLTGNITITPPLDYEVSLNNVNWFNNNNPLVITPAAGSVVATTVRVRLNASSTGEHNGTVSIKSTGTTDKQIALTGFTYRSMVLAPNPAKDIVTLYHPQFFTTGYIKIFDQAGKLVKTLRSTPASGSTQINISTLPAGIYSLEFTRNEEYGKIRFIKL